ncbi:conserved hypothetical protein [Chlorobium limicola DSM 245]|uniref:Uncharacterized protein n=1 Tax=Chlorobium limicola (strain DSM 245 / NBRC 103803 / 6330) TaxID=290315 RepID=B3EHF4_CHLL2|nr:hypothetical protein [Chlorobium limicola]ACD91316.1 conserved hypothetical protein [Chlorobium limicola DSM 245]
MKESTEHQDILIRALLLFMAMLLMLPFPACAKPVERAPAVRVSAAPDSVYAGERVICMIRVQHSEGLLAALELPDSSVLAPFCLVGRNRSSSKPAPGLAEDRFELEFAVFGSGKQSIPQFALLFRDPEGHVTGRTHHRPQASVYVKTLTPSGMNELRPFKPPIQPEFPILLLMPFLLAAFALAGAVLLALFLVKRKVRLFAETVDPAQVAHRKLRKLGSRLSGGLAPVECYDQLSGIMREYLERHYHIRALEAVTQEIERDLRKLGVSSFDAIMTLLKQSDLVKFADSRPSLDESLKSIRQAEDLIGSGRDGGG